MFGFFEETVIKNPSLPLAMKLVNQVEDLLIAVVQGVQYLDGLNGIRPKPVTRKEFSFKDNTAVDASCTLGDLIDYKIEGSFSFSIDDRLQRDEELGRVRLLKKAAAEIEEEKGYEELKRYTELVPKLKARFDLRTDIRGLYKAVEEIRDIAKRYSDLGVDEATAMYNRYSKIARKHKRFGFLKPRGTYESSKHGLISNEVLAKVLAGKDPDIKALEKPRKSVAVKVKKTLATAAVVGMAFAAGFGLGYKPVEQKPAPVVRYVKQEVVQPGYEQREHIYNVKKGDTLWDITKETLGTTDDRETYEKCDLIAAANRKGKQADYKVGVWNDKSPHSIDVGDEIVIPSYLAKGAFISGRPIPAAEMFNRLDVFSYARNEGYSLNRFCYDALKQDEAAWLLDQYKNSDRTVKDIRKEFTQNFGMSISTGSFYKVVDKLEKGCRRCKNINGGMNGI